MDNTPERNLLLCSALGMTFMFPWTILVIAPVNSLLMDGETPKKKGDTWVLEMMTKWDRVHGVRIYKKIKESKIKKIKGL